MQSILMWGQRCELVNGLLLDFETGRAVQEMKASSVEAARGFCSEVKTATTLPHPEHRLQAPPTALRTGQVHQMRVSWWQVLSAYGRGSSDPASAAAAL